MSRQERKEKKAQKKAAKAAAVEERHAREARHAHLRANARTRRAAYWTVVVLGIAIFAVSIVDMIYLENQLYWGVLSAYATLVVIALFLFVSRRVKDDASTYAVEETAPAQVGEFALKCTSCTTVFAYDQHVLETHAGWFLACPDCGLEGPLPKMEAAKGRAGGHGTGAPAATV